MKLETKQQKNRLIVSLTLVYFVSYITRINYSAVITEMVSATGLSRTVLSMALTGLFVTYGIGQVLSGVLGDHISTKRLIALGLGMASAMNVILPLCKNPYLMLVVWCVNGFAQALLWPPMVRMMTLLLTETDYHRAVVRVSFGSAFGTIAVYLVAPLVISLADWRAVFFLSAACGALMLLVWLCYGYDVKPQPRPKAVAAETSEAREQNKLFTPLLLCIMLAIVLQGMMRDGVTTWLPSYVAETYQMENAVAILTSVVLPVFSMICFQLSDWLYQNRLKNPLLCAGFFFGVGALCALLLLLVTGRSATLSLILAALVAGCMHGVNLMLISMVPPFYGRGGRVSTVSGVLNSCTYIGSAIFTYGVALLSESKGWSFTLAVWLGITAVGTLLCLACVRPWKKKFAQ